MVGYINKLRWINNKVNIDIRKDMNNRLKKGKLFKHGIPEEGKMKLTWTANDIMVCLDHGYTLVATYTSSNSSNRVSITDTKTFMDYFKEYGSFFIPRYIHYHEKIFIHIEVYDDSKFEEWLEPKLGNDKNAAHLLLLARNRITKSQYNELLHLDIIYNKKQTFRKNRTSM